MEDEDRTPPHVVELLQQLRLEPHSFDFFQAIRLLDCAHPDKPQTGHSVNLKDDPIRLSQEPSTNFAPATLAELQDATEYHPPRLVQRFLGLLGPQGPLPIHLTDYALSRINHHKDHTFHRFLDVFHHRILGLFYRSWARVRPTVNFDKGSKDRFGDYVASLFGLGMPSLLNRDALSDLPKRHFAGLMSCQTKHADGLLAILSGYFNLPVEIDQFVGQWIDLPTTCQCRMGAAGGGSLLGKSITVGSQVWDCQQKFRIVMGPLSLPDYCRLLPGGGATEDEGSDSRLVSLDALVALVRGYVGDNLEWDLQLILKKDEAPSISLGSQGQLGWSTWNYCDALEENPDDLILDPLRSCKEAEQARQKVKLQKVKKASRPPHSSTTR